MELCKDSQDYQALIRVAILALAALENEIGMGKANNELPPFTAQLDTYLANELSEKLWDYLSDEVMKLKPIAADDENEGA